MYENIFELVKCDYSKSILKVKTVDNLTIAEYPFINAKMDYITITHGENHIMTVINKDGSTWSITWGKSGYTLCSDSVRNLRCAAVDFLQKECKILLELKTPIKRASIFFNPHCNTWQLSFNSTQHLFFEDCGGVADVISKAKDYIGEQSWKYQKAPTGIDTWVTTL